MAFAARLTRRDFPGSGLLNPLSGSAAGQPDGALSKTSGEAAQRAAAVVGDHVGQRRDDVDTRTERGEVEFGVGAVEVADDALRIEEAGVLSEVQFARGVQR